MKPIGPIIAFVLFFATLAVLDLFYQTGLMLHAALRAQVRIASALEKIVAIKDPELKAAAANKASLSVAREDYCHEIFPGKKTFWNGAGCSEEVLGCAHGTGVCHQ